MNDMTHDMLYQCNMPLYKCISYEHLLPVHTRRKITWSKQFVIIILQNTNKKHSTH